MTDPLTLGEIQRDGLSALELAPTMVALLTTSHADDFASYSAIVNEVKLSEAADLIVALTAMLSQFVDAYAGTSGTPREHLIQQYATRCAQARLT